MEKRRLCLTLIPLVLLVGLPVAMQTHLFVSTTPVLGGMYIVLGLPSACILGLAAMVVGFVVVARAEGKDERNRRLSTLGMALLLLPAYLGIAVVAAEFVVAAQREANDASGGAAVKAIAKYRERHQRYPACLDELVPAYLGDIPKYKHGFVRLRFDYWLEGGEPELKYCSGMLASRIYDFQRRKWSDDIL